MIYNALFLADVLGLTKENISSQINAIANLDLKNIFVDNSSIKMLLGDYYGDDCKDVLKRVIEQFGNFREIFEETYGKYASTPYIGQTQAINRVLNF